MAENDGTYQEMSVHDKEWPNLGPTWEEQDVSRLDKIVVPPPAYTDPSNPAAASGSINFNVDTHPSAISDDYAADTVPGEDDLRKPADTHAVEMAQVVTGFEESATDYPENRDEWQKKHWVARAQELGLHTSGNTDAVKDRVEERESDIEDAKALSAADWKDAIDNADNQGELDDVKALYTASGAEYSTVEAEFEKRSADFNS